MITVHADGWLDAGADVIRCALGVNGVAAASAKREGDGCTPVGVWPFRRVLYRPDRVERPRTRLATMPLRPEDGWCDDPADAAYNRAVTLPYPASAEALWRADELYDVIVVLGHNDDPVIAAAGSAIFLHVASAGYAPTQGCVAVSRVDLGKVLAAVGPGDALAIQLAPLRP